MLTRSEFEKFIKAQQEPLRRFLLNLSNGNSSLADDIAQEAFIKAYLGLSTFQGRSNLSTWLFKIAYNTYLNEVSKKSQSKGAVEIENAGRGVVDEYSSAETAFKNQELFLALKQLEGDEKVVILLFYMEDMKIREISKITGISIGTIKSHLSRGRDRLKKYLLKNG